MESRLYLDNCSFDRKNQITKWKKIAKIDIDVSDKVESMANDIMKNKIKPKDSLHSVLPKMNLPKLLQFFGGT